MKKAKIAELKNRLSYYLRFVRQGEPVTVYDRDRPIARIDPLGGTGAVDQADPEFGLLGYLRPPTAALPKRWLRGRFRTRANAVATLLEERETGR